MRALPRPLLALFLVVATLALSGCWLQEREQEPPPASVYPESTFTCCRHGAIGRIVDAYLVIQEGLAQGRRQQVEDGVQALERAARSALEDPRVGSAQRARVASVLGSLKALEWVGAHRSVETMPELSEHVIVLAKSSPGGTRALAVGHCTETDSNWLQRDTALANPYLGPTGAHIGRFR